MLTSVMMICYSATESVKNSQSRIIAYPSRNRIIRSHSYGHARFCGDEIACISHDLTLMRNPYRSFRGYSPRA